ncbi:hypothetical protein KCU91_g8822, partial [Aureobasidium melanogenum]
MLRDMRSACLEHRNLTLPPQPASLPGPRLQALRDVSQPLTPAPAPLIQSLINARDFQPSAAQQDAEEPDLQPIDLVNALSNLQSTPNNLLSTLRNLNLQPMDLITALSKLLKTPRSLVLQTKISLQHPEFPLTVPSTARGP